MDYNEPLGVCYITPTILREMADDMEAGVLVKELELANGVDIIELEWDGEGV